MSAFSQIASPNFITLADTYRDAHIQFPQLKGVTLAQWALESGWGKTRLAKEHQNYAGMKWGQVDTAFGSPVMYGGTKYTQFTSPTTFIEGYWNRVMHTNIFGDWHGHVDTPEEFIRWLTPMWLNGRHETGELLANEKTYIRDVLDIRKRRTEPFFKET